jgi:hypothetical protein
MDSSKIIIITICFLLQVQKMDFFKKNSNLVNSQGQIKDSLEKNIYI